MFVLSDSEKCFSQSCNTQHKHSCEQCIDLADFLAEISTLTQNGTWDNKDFIVFQVENAVEAIKDWKSHAMRARIKKISQDGSVTASVLCDVVHDLTKQVPNIQEVNFFSDNAGCYKNTMMMVALKDELGDKLKTYNFSEAQDGKGKRISWDNIGTTEQRTNLLVKVDWTITAPQLLEVEVMAQEEELIEPNPKKQKKNSINQPYDCPKDGCTRAFKTQCALEQHIIFGNCDYHNEKTTQDKAKSISFSTEVKPIKIGPKEEEKIMKALQIENMSS
ncbi:unnamed protein product [Mytilus edulis]|uniref:C2H2-type domain-containing protein n=1 Tax=Mytilus edulis TaxID=6550 RepID=A0A8S3R105_MYTED|nr:unnamed protein product [Mytilus edulis]